MQKKDYFAYIVNAIFLILSAFLLVTFTLWMLADVMGQMLLQKYDSITHLEKGSLFLEISILLMLLGSSNIINRIWYGEQRGYLSNLVPALGYVISFLLLEIIAQRKVDTSVAQVILIWYLPVCTIQLVILFHRLKAVDCIIDAYRNGNKILCCGNGGSATDSLHIVGELMKAFVCKRKVSAKWQEKFSICKDGDYIIKNLQMALPAISLVSEIGLLTAYANDVAPDMNFAQQVFGQGKTGDVLLAISTSGNSKNVLYAAEVAKAMGIMVIGLTGKNGGALKALADVMINVPEVDTFKIQELHLPVYHAICLAVEEEFYHEEE